MKAVIRVPGEFSRDVEEFTLLTLGLQHDFVKGVEIAALQSSVVATFHALGTHFTMALKNTSRGPELMLPSHTHLRMPVELKRTREHNVYRVLTGKDDLHGR